MPDIVISESQIAAAVRKQGRVNRNPRHSFHIAYPAWGIQPFMCAPVLPGETMKNLLLQARTITHPVANPIVGWWNEFYIFYIKLRDLDNRDEMVEMLMTPGVIAADYNNGGTGSVKSYDSQAYASVGPNYVRRCLDRVVAEYFRDEGEDNVPMLERTVGNAGLRPGLPPARLKMEADWLDSAKLASAMGDEGTDVLLDQTTRDVDIPPGFEAHYEQYMHMRSLKMVDVTFGDWLKQFGVRVPKQDTPESHRPELIRYMRDWQYPSNTINPQNGTPSSAVSWATAERADKDRYFNEPGFIFGVTVTRPKVYLGHQWSAAVNMLNDAFAWLPAMMSDDPYTSLRKFTPMQGPLAHPEFEPGRVNEDYWVDARDLFLYGDQFLAGTSAQNGPGDPGYGGALETQVLNMPNSLEIGFDLLEPNSKYPNSGFAAKFFRNANQTRIMSDGVVNLTIAGTQRDHT